MPESKPSTSSVLEDLRVLQDRVVERIRELEPFARELAELREQAERLGIKPSPVSARAQSDKANVKSPARRSRRPQAGTSRRRGATSGTSRAEQVLAVVREHPGTTMKALGEALGVDSTGLYRVVRTLESEGLVRKEGRHLQPVRMSDDPGVTGA